MCIPNDGHVIFQITGAPRIRSYAYFCLHPNDKQPPYTPALNFLVQVRAGECAWLILFNDEFTLFRVKGRVYLATGSTRLIRLTLHPVILQVDNENPTVSYPVKQFLQLCEKPLSLVNPGKTRRTC